MPASASMRDRVAVNHECQRSAGRRLRIDLADDEALVDEARELAVGHDRHGGTETGAVDRKHDARRHAHAGAAAHAKPAQDHGVAGHDLACTQRCRLHRPRS